MYLNEEEEDGFSLTNSLPTADLEKWQSLWKEENRYWAADEEPAVTVHSGVYLKETQLLQREGRDFLLQKVG